MYDKIAEHIQNIFWFQLNSITYYEFPFYVRGNGYIVRVTLCTNLTSLISVVELVNVEQAKVVWKIVMPESQT